MANTKKTTSQPKQTKAEDLFIGQETPATETAEKKTSMRAADIDPTQYVIVRNGFHGKLIYDSQRTGEHFVWKDFGDEQEMELRELRNAKNSYKKYFENNWFMFDEDWIIEYLGVKQYYRHAISIDKFDNIFNLSADELRQTLAKLSNGQKKSVAYRAKELIKEEVIDSMSVVRTLEELLGVELIQK